MQELRSEGLNQGTFTAPQTVQHQPQSQGESIASPGPSSSISCSSWLLPCAGPAPSSAASAQGDGDHGHGRRGPHGKGTARSSEDAIPSQKKHLCREGNQCKIWKGHAKREHYGKEEPAHGEGA